MPSHQNSNENGSMSKTFGFFRHGCCVPTTSVLWMIVVLFIFTSATFIFCCFAVFFIRWMYKRNIRKRTEVVRDRYRKEADLQKETEVRLKEIALRPIQTQVFLPCLEHEHHIPPSVLPQLTSISGGYRESLQSRPSLSSGKKDLSASFVPSFGDHMKKQVVPVMGTGDTKKQIAGDDFKQITGADQNLPSKQPTSTGPTLSCVTASSGDTTSPPAAPSEQVQMKPADVAGAVHTIAKHCAKIEQPSPLPEIVLSSALSKDTKDIASDVVGPSEDATLADQSSTETSSTKTSVTSKTTNTTSAQSSSLGSTTTSKKMINGEVDISLSTLRGAQGARNRDRYQKSEKVKEAEAKNATDESLSQSKYSSVMQPWKTYFPYWTAQRKITTTIDEDVSTSGRVHGSKVTRSEVSSWMPLGSKTSEQTKSSLTTKDTMKDTKESSKEQVAPQPTSRPPDVYELRRQLDRIQANQISKGMQLFLIEAGKRSSSSVKMSPLPTTSDAVNKSSPIKIVMPSTPKSLTTSEVYPTTFAGLRSTFKKWRDERLETSTTSKRSARY